MLETLINYAKYIGEGIDRKAYDCLIPGYIIKMSLSGSSEYQNENEASLFNCMPIEHKLVFPIVAVEDGYIMMRKCEIVCDNETYKSSGSGISHLDCLEEYLEIAELLNLDKDSAKAVYDFVRGNGINDVHCGNLGILDGRLVITDCGGGMSDGDDDWNSDYNSSREYST